MTAWKEMAILQPAWQEGDRWGMEQHGEELGPFAVWLWNRLQPDDHRLRVLEIGTRRGGTLAFWHTLLRAERTLGIDLPDDWTAGQARAHVLQHTYANLYVHLGSSHDLAALWSATLTGPFDFVFIDGDHTLAGVAADYHAYAPLVRPGGVIAFHDIVDSPENVQLGIGVPAFWRGLTEDKREFCLHAPWGGIGALITPGAV